MSKITIILFMGVLFLLEGYFEFCRDLIMNTHFMGPTDQDIYLKAVPVDDELGLSILFYLFGVILIVLAGFLWSNVSKGKNF